MSPRGQYPRKQQQIQETESIVITTNVLTTLPWWKKLSATEQQSVAHESAALAHALLDLGGARLAVGEHLERLQSVLEPHNLFQKFLKNFRFSLKTAYRYIAGYKNAKALLPNQVLQVAMARGIPILGDTSEKPLGVYTEAVKTLPPPSAPTEKQASDYLDALEKMRRENRSHATVLELPVGDPSTLLKESLRFVSTRYKRLPQNKRTRDAWAARFLSMCLAEFGMTGQHTLTSIPVPEELQVRRGAPRGPRTTTTTAATA